VLSLAVLQMCRGGGASLPNPPVSGSVWGTAWFTWAVRSNAVAGCYTFSIKPQFLSGLVPSSAKKY